MNLRDLKYFVALAEHLHFGRAAAACFVSQPTLSTQIRKLEEELGVALVERAPRRVMLTPAGRDVAARARRVVADIAQMREAARRSHDPEARSEEHTSELQSLMRLSYAVFCQVISVLTPSFPTPRSS